MTAKIFTTAKTILAIGAATVFLAACQTAAPSGGGSYGGGGVLRPVNPILPLPGANTPQVTCANFPQLCPNTGGNQNAANPFPRVGPNIPALAIGAGTVIDQINPRVINPALIRP